MSRRPSQVEVLPDDPPIRAAQKGIARHGERLMRHAEALRDGSRDPEDIHDMRVATRRIRSIIQVFRQWLPAPETRELARDLRRFTRRLGAVRDLDVLLASMRGEPRGRLAEEARQEFVRQRDEARRRLDRDLKGDRLVRLQARLEEFQESLRRQGAHQPGKVCLVAAGMVFGTLGEVRSLAPGPDPSLEDLHRFRIAVKGLRYTVEALADLLGETGAAFLAEVRQIQDLLGTLQDHRVAADRIDAFLAARQDPARLRAPLVAWAERRRQQAEELRQVAPDRWAAFDSSGMRQRLGALLAGF